LVSTIDIRWKVTKLPPCFNNRITKEMVGGRSGAYVWRGDGQWASCRVITVVAAKLWVSLILRFLKVWQHLFVRPAYGTVVNNPAVVVIVTTAIVKHSVK